MYVTEQGKVMKVVACVQMENKHISNIASFQSSAS